MHHKKPIISGARDKKDIDQKNIDKKDIDQKNIQTLEDIEFVIDTSTTTTTRETTATPEAKLTPGTIMAKLKDANENSLDQLKAYMEDTVPHPTMSAPKTRSMTREGQIAHQIIADLKNERLFLERKNEEKVTSADVITACEGLKNIFKKWEGNIKTLQEFDVSFNEWLAQPDDKTLTTDLVAKTQAVNFWREEQGGERDAAAQRNAKAARSTWMEVINEGYNYSPTHLQKIQQHKELIAAFEDWRCNLTDPNKLNHLKACLRTANTNHISLKKTFSSFNGLNKILQLGIEDCNGLLKLLVNQSSPSSKLR